MLTSLIVCACHAALRCLGFTDPLQEVNWFLQPFQRGEAKFYIEHMRRAVEEAAKNPNAILVFSGGQTRKEAGPISEALSYWLVCEFYGWWGHLEVRDRTILEEFARDSEENVLFSIARFREYTGSYPEQVSVVSWSFKQERFDLHRQALLIPTERFVFIGANNPDDLAGAQKGEAKAVVLFRADPYGCVSDLAKKREDRNPGRHTHPYRSSAPEIRALFDHKGPELYDGSVPWPKAA